jgi:hypothetical protein
LLKNLEDALAKVLRLPADKQEVAAELLEQLASSSDPYPRSDEERAIVRDALARARSGELASDEQLEAALRRPWS